MKYSHGANTVSISRKIGCTVDELSDYSSNINCYFQPKWLKKVYLESFNKIKEYPDIENYDLKLACAKYENINVKNLIVGSGASTLLFELVRLINPRDATILVPTFLEYDRALKAIGCKVNYIKFNKELNKMKDLISNLTECIFICNPNNPTGQLLSRNELNDFIEWFKDKWIIIDESFIDFCENDESCKKLLTKHQKLIIIKSYTKFFQCAGLRFGIVMSSNAKLIRNYNYWAIPWSINGLVKDIIVNYLKDVNFIDNSKLVNKVNREWLTKQLMQLGLEVFKSQTNFILFKSDDLDLYNKLLKKRIIIRNCDNFKGLSRGYYRVCVSNMKMNKKLVNALKEITDEKM